MPSYQDLNFTLQLILQNPNIPLETLTKHPAVLSNITVDRLLASLQQLEHDKLIVKCYEPNEDSYIAYYFDREIFNSAAKRNKYYNQPYTPPYNR